MFVLHAEKLSSHTISTVVSTPCPDPYPCLSFKSGLIVSGLRTTINQSLIGKGTSNSSSFLDPFFLLQPVTT